MIHIVLAALLLAVDSGPPADIAAVRAAEVAASHARGTLKIENIRVVGDWAVLEWIVDPSGGMSAYHRTSSGTWKRFMSDGGAFAASDLEKNGCPAAIARQLIPRSPG